MVLALVAKALLAVVVFGTIAFIDDIVDAIAGPQPGPDADLVHEEQPEQ